MQFSVHVFLSIFFWLLFFARIDNKKNQPSDTCSLVKKWEPSLNEPVKTLEV